MGYKVVETEQAVQDLDGYMRTKLPPKENGDFIQEICIFLLINPRIACII